MRACWAGSDPWRKGGAENGGCACAFEGDTHGNKGGEEDPLVTVSIHLRKSQLASLDRLADAEHRSRAELVREAIDLLLKRLKLA